MIYGERIRLRALEKADLSKFVEWLNDPAVRENLLISRPISMAEEERWFEGVLGRSPYEKPLCIEAKQGAEWQIIGNLGFKDVDLTNRSAELGISIGEKSFWNQGYGTEAISLYVQHAFNDLNLHRVYLEVYATHSRGIRCYEKVGFRHEGTKREAIFKDGKYIDLHIMGVLSTEWKK